MYSFPFTPGRRSCGEFQRKLGALAVTVAASRKTTAHFFRGVGPAVEAEAVTVLLGRKTVVENLGHVLWGNPDAIIADNHLHAVR